MTDSTILIGAIIVVLLLAAAALVQSLWWGFGTVAGKRISTRREMCEAILADLWSGETHRRFASLIALQKMNTAERERSAIASALIAYIRQRLSGSGRDDAAGYEDVRLAVSLLSRRRIALLRPQMAIDLTGINFSATPLFGSDFSRFRLINCDFSGCLAMRAAFRTCDLTGTSFVGADLRGADFTGADLSDANFTNANLSGARLTRASMVSTNISGAVLVGTIGLSQDQLDSAIGDSGTAVPEQFRFVPMKSRRGTAKLRSVSSE